MNLIKNALKFTRKGSVVIKVAYSYEPDHLFIAHVIDTGSGIAQQDFHKLFTRFGKLQRTAQMNNEGVGLGLSMVKQIVESSGGKIAVKSDGIGHGSTFCFSMHMEQCYDSNDDDNHYKTNPLALLAEEKKSESSDDNIEPVKKEGYA